MIPFWAVRVLSFLSQIVGIVTGIQSAQAEQATATGVAALEGALNDVIDTIDSPTFGNAAIKTAIDTLTSNQATEFADIMAAIAATQQAGSPVTLPTTPPAGYGSTDASTIAAVVWAFPGPTSANAAIDLLEQSAVDGQQWSQWNDAVQFNSYGGWELIPRNFWSEIVNIGSGLLPLDWTTVSAGDNTAVEWLNRVAEEILFTDIGGGVPSATDDAGNLYLVPWLNTPTFQILRDQQLQLNRISVAPVWPGLANVTLGTPVAISSSFTVTGPMHGVLIDITAILANKPFFDFDGSLSYRNIGALAFQEDNGQEEFPQNLGFTSAVYCPKTMKQAANCVIRADASITGTVTPWVIT